MRPAQIRMLAFFSLSNDSVSALVRVNDFVREHLMWWASTANLSRGVRFPSLPTKHVFSTVALLIGWGSHLNDRMVSGLWTPLDTQSHINLEWWAVLRAAHHYEDIVACENVLIRTDNSTVDTYLNKEGVPVPPFCVPICSSPWLGVRGRAL